MEQPIIHVGILTSNNIKFELHGDYKIAGTDEKFSGQFEAHLDGDVIVVEGNGKKFSSTADIYFEPSNFESEAFVLRDVVIGIQFHWQRKEKQKFLGTLRFVIENGNLVAVNVIPIEHYLVSVISSEMRATSSIDLLKAHAIISRSWLIAQLDKNKKLKEEGAEYVTTLTSDGEITKWWDREEHNLYDVCADDHCQRYQGITKIYSDSAKQAIDSTFGLVLLNDGHVCDARFSKSCGGVSENFENVWEPVHHPYLTAVVDWKHNPENFNMDLTVEENAREWILNEPAAFCNTKDNNVLSQVLQEYDQTTADFYRWKVEYSQNEISELVKKRINIDFGQIIDLVPVERGKSGRITRLKVIGTKKEMIIGKELLIRKAFSETHLYSSAFVVERTNINAEGIPEKITLRGAGWGHGVGLCQIGAALMAEMGYKFDEILYHYFKNIELKKIY